MIYFDNAATTRPNGECLKKAEKYLYNDYFNPSALYAEGYSVQLALREARKNIIENIADSERFDLLFTSCGTEADNTAIFGGAKRGNVVTTAGEHSAVYACMSELKQRGTEVRLAALNADGSVNTDSLISLVDEKTSLVSVIHVSNETGAVNDIARLAAAVKKKNKYTLFHSDGVQAYGKIPFRLTCDIDMYSVSAHKIGGIKGCGALIKRKNLIIKPYIFGGGQENGLRSGTENVFGIKVFEYAAEARYAHIADDFKKAQALRALLKSRLDKSLFTEISGENCSPYRLIIGTGSACASNEKKRYSRTILACGVGERLADGILRLSLCADNTEKEVLTAAEILNRIVKNRKEIMA